MSVVEGKDMSWYEGRYLSFAVMSDTFVADAIKKGLIEGHSWKDHAFWGAGACITSEQQALQQFIRDYDAQLYPEDSWAAYMQLPSDR